jgi:hypothetical protein
MQTVDDDTGARAFQTVVAMRYGTFAFLPGSGGPRWPVILHLTPYGIAAADAHDKTDCTKAWLPSTEEPLRGSILRGSRNIVAHGYVAVYQDTRGRHGSEGRTGSTPTMPRTDTTSWSGSPPSRGAISAWGSRALRPAPRRHLRLPRRGTRRYARF